MNPPPQDLNIQRLLDTVSDHAIYMLDADGRVASWNAGAARLKGYSAQEIVGQHFSAFYTAEDRAAGRPEQILEVVRRQGRFEDESWRVRKDGTRFWANVVILAKPIRWPSSSWIGSTTTLAQKRLPCLRTRQPSAS